ncbi:MAG: hypothetical protein WDM79_02780 [Terricaulis sp.]
MASASLASAEPWSAPDARMIFNAPAGWAVQRVPVENRVYVVAQTDTKQCHLMTMSRPATQDAAPRAVREAGAQPLAPAVWERLPPALPRVFGPESHLVSTTIDTAGAWPIQFGRYESPTRIVHAAVQFRPGQEFWSFCYAASEVAGDAGAFATLQRSVASTDDAQLQAAIDAEYGAAEAQSAQRELDQLAYDQRRLRSAGITSPDPGNNSNQISGDP